MQVGIVDTKREGFNPKNCGASVISQKVIFYMFSIFHGVYERLNSLLLRICLHFRMAANSHEDRTHWVSAIQDSIQVDPAYDIVRQKKAALRRKSIRFVYIFLTSFFSNPIF